MSSQLIAESAVRHTVASVMHDIDARRWQRLADHFAPKVTTDYRSLFGGDIQTQAAEALVDGWRAVLTPLEATQHVLGPITVKVVEAAALAECHVRAYHLAPGTPGGDEWMVAGHYVFTLAPPDWRITAMTLQTYYQTGNRNLLQEAGKGR